MRVQDRSICRWVGEFREGGIDALCYRASYGRSLKLKAEQINEPKALVRAQPEITTLALCQEMQKRFGVAYTAVGIMRLLKQNLGIIRERGSLVLR
jgi:transposase